MVAEGCSKFIIVVINLVFLAFGTAILACGLVFKLDWDEVRDAFQDKSDEVDLNLQEAGDMLANSCIAFGAFIIILSLIGCIGGCCKVRFLLAIYAILVLVILISQVVVVALVVANGDEAEDKVIQGLRDSLNNYNEESNNTNSKGWSALFSTIECCGVVNYTLEFNTTNFQMSSLRTAPQVAKRPIIPVTCCKHFDYEATATADVFKEENINKCLIEQTTEYAYTTGCESKISDFIDDHKEIVLGVGVTVFLVEILVVILGFFLCCRNDE